MRRKNSARVISKCHVKADTVYISLPTSWVASLRAVTIGANAWRNTAGFLERESTNSTWCIAAARMIFCPELSVSELTFCSGSKDSEAAMKSVRRGLDESNSFGLLMLLNIPNLYYDSYSVADR